MFKFAIKNMLVRRTKLLLTALSVVIAASVSLLAYNVSAQISDGIVHTAANCDLIIGPSGSATQLAMNTMFFTDKPLGTIDYDIIDELQRSGLVNSVIPFSMGDSFNSAPIVGTTAELLDGKPLQSGAMFENACEVVVGSDIAARYSLHLGDMILSSHGLSGSGAAHEASPLTVVGILDRTDTSYDNVVFTPCETIWALHDHDDHDHEDGDADADHDHESEDDHDHEAEDDHDHEAEADHESEADHEAEASPSVNAHATASVHPGQTASPEDASPAADAEAHGETQLSGEEHKEICAVLVKSKSIADYTTLMNHYSAESGYLAINPATVLREVLNNVDMSRKIVYLLCAIILVMNIFVVSVIAVLNMYDSGRQISLMRLIGVSMRKINLLFLIQNAFVGLAAMLAALGLSHGFLWGMRGFVSSMGIVLNASHVYPFEWVLLVCVFVLSILPTTLCTMVMARRDGIL